jgi:recombination protein RecA
MDIRRIGGIKGAENAEIGNRVKVKIVKNKLAPPFKTAEFDILFNEGISRIGSIIDLGTDLQIIDKKGTWFSFKGTRLGQGREAAREELKKNPTMVDELEKLILTKVSEKGLTDASKEDTDTLSEIVEALS